MNKIRNTKGITLIALVITIIILIILAGITISSLNKNGIFEKLKLAKIESQLSALEEEANFIIQEMLIDQYTKEEKYGLSDIVSELRKRGYKIDEKNNSENSITDLILDNNFVLLEVGETTAISVSFKNNAEESSSYYVSIGEKYYKMIFENGRVKVSRNVSNISDNNILEATVEDLDIVSIEDITLSTILIKANKNGKTKINIKYGECEKSCEVNVFNKKLNISITPIIKDDISANEVEVTLNIVDNNTNEKYEGEYIQEYKYYLYKGEQLVKTDVVTSNNWTINELEPNKTYNLYVEAISIEGQKIESSKETYTKKLLYTWKVYEIVRETTYELQETSVTVEASVWERSNNGVL